MIKIKGRDSKQIITTAEACFEVMKALLKREGEVRHSGYFTVSKVNSLAHLIAIELGDGGLQAQDDLDRFQVNSKEKATRLISGINEGYTTSWQTRNPNENHYGGAVIICDEYAFSFSGLPELHDEALMLYVAYCSGLISKSDAFKIASISENDYFFMAVEFAYGFKYSEQSEKI